MTTGSFPPACLWISRELPYPVDAGDRNYAHGLTAALAGTGMEVHFLGHDLSNGAPAPAIDRVTWHPITGGRAGRIPSLVSPLPLVASVQATPAFRRQLTSLLASRPWNAILIDQLGSSWALPICLAHAARSSAPPVLVHISHNRETAVWDTMWRQSRAGPVRRLVLYQNYLKTRALETRTLALCDLVTTITSVDDALQREAHPGLATLLLPPGYGGSEVVRRTITEATPRRVVIVGSFRWVAKQENLRQFLLLADPAFARAGIALDIVGDVPEPLASELRARCRATTLHGFVDDVAPLLSEARLGVVPEIIGGGFKLKFLDYLFGRVPVATIRSAAAGLSADVTSRMVLADTLDVLVDRIVATIDDVPTLNAMHEGAFRAAQHDYRWPARGRALRNAIDRIHAARRARRTTGSA